MTVQSLQRRAHQLLALVTIQALALTGVAAQTQAGGDSGFVFRTKTR